MPFTEGWTECLDLSQSVGTKSQLRYSVMNSFIANLIRLVLVAILLTTGFVASANAATFGCEVGYELNPATNTCEPFWLDFSGNDGFTRTVQVAILSSNNSYSSGFKTTYYLEVICQARKLSVIFYSGPIGLYADANLYGNGTGQVKFDNARPLKLRYQRSSDLEGVYFTDAKNFVKRLAKARSNVSVKVFGIDGPAIGTFPKANFSSYVNKIRSGGCRF